MADLFCGLIDMPASQSHSIAYSAKVSCTKSGIIQQVLSGRVNCLWRNKRSRRISGNINDVRNGDSHNSLSLS